MTNMLRYEIYIPLKDNSNKPIKSHGLIEKKIQDRFGGISTHMAIVKGVWVHPKSSKVYRDDCYRYEVVVENNKKNKKFFIGLKEELKTLLNQHEIFMICSEIDWV